MECLPVNELPDSPDWVYELKLDGFRGQANSGQKRRPSAIEKREGLLQEVSASLRCSQGSSATGNRR